MLLEDVIEINNILMRHLTNIPIWQSMLFELVTLN